jgi:hypothetical protein
MKTTTLLNYSIFYKNRILFLSLLCIILFFPPFESLCPGQSDAKHLLKDNSFPVCTQFSKVPSGKGWSKEEFPLSDKVLEETVQNINDHGFNLLTIFNYSKNSVDDEQQTRMLKYAQAAGMKFDYLSGGYEIFNRDDAPKVSVYSAKYIEEVRKKALSDLSQMKSIKGLRSIFPYQDEPFHAGPEMFDYSSDAQAEFFKRYGYRMPLSPDSVRNNPGKWLDLLNFQSTTFPDGWKQVYKTIKEIDPGLKIIMTHDSHNTFGAGVKSNSRMAVDDVFHWGGDFADMFVFDIYPYMMFDFRYGEFGKIPLPRQSQMHYTMAQMRNLTTEYKKDLGFWVGTYNKTWFAEFMDQKRKDTYWSEREMSYTAIANGANYLKTGLNIPEDAHHWEDFGQAMNIIRKAGPGLLEAPKIKAKACFLFPRTQYLLLQEEYFNVGLSFELFLRTFGELDIIHEEQVRDGKLADYDILILCDVKLLPVKVAQQIVKFTKKGGSVIADCVPVMDAYKEPADIMLKLFGVSTAETGRMVQEGHWVPYTTKAPEMIFSTIEGQKLPDFKTDAVSGNAFGQSYKFTVASPRACKVSEGKVSIPMESGLPALVIQEAGKGKVYLFGFCIQDTYFRTWKENDGRSRDDLMRMIGSVLRNTGVKSHVWSSNPGIEAAIRANSSEGYLFVINHEENQSETLVKLNGLAFTPVRIINIENDQPVDFKNTETGIELNIIAPFGTASIFKISGKQVHQ